MFFLGLFLRQVIVAPYVPHALLTRAGKSGCETRKDVLRAKRGESLDRSISLYFRGSVMHGCVAKLLVDEWSLNVCRGPHLI